MSSRRFVAYGGVCGATTVMAMGLLALIGVFDASPSEPILIKAQHDFGYVHPGQPVQHAFALTNNWSRPFRIQRIRVDCGCIHTTLGKSVLGPRERTPLQIAVQTRDYPERRRFQVLVEGTVGRSPATFLFELRARSANVIELSPSSQAIDFGDCSMEQLPKRMAMEIRKGDYPLQWDALECRSTDPMLTTSIRDNGPDRWQVELTLNRPPAYGAFHGELEFLFKSQGQELPYRYSRPVHASIVGPLAAVPGTLLIGAIRPGEQVIRKIQVERRLGDINEPVEVLSVETADRGCVKATIQREMNRQWIEAVFTGQDAEGPRSGVLVITAKAEQTCTINVGYLLLMLPNGR